MAGLTGREEDIVRERISSYLSRDRDGRRLAVLSMFCNGEMLSTAEIEKRLREIGFEVKSKGTPAMVGLMGSKTGVLHVDISGENNLYTIKEKYRDIIHSITKEHNRQGA